MAEEYEVLYNLLPELAVALQKTASEAVKKAAFDIQKLAAENAPVDTGFLKSSIYTVTQGASTYGQGVTAGGGGPDTRLLDEVAAPTSATEAVVAVGANYGAFVELGTKNMAAQPYLIPAAEAERPQLTAALSRLEEAMKAGGISGIGGGRSNGGEGEE